MRLISSEFFAYILFLRAYIKSRGYRQFSRFESGKDFLVDLLYKKRGKYARPFLHFGTVFLTFFVITFGPYILEQSDTGEGRQASLGLIQTSAIAFDQNLVTLQAEEVRQYRGGEVTLHTIQEGETISSIAQKYSLRQETVLWENNLTEKSKIKPEDELGILPIDGIRHKVVRGETIFSVAKKYGLEEGQAQSIVNYPFNEFLNDETFELATGQFLMVPDGVKPDPVTRLPVASFAVVQTPDAGTVTAVGSFVWPASGRITQGYRFYHKAIDIANKSGGAVLAADSGTVTVAGWPDNGGYGNRVMIDHGNGFVTNYAHLSSIQVRPGQRVNRGDIIGQMGSTGRSTGVHLHFEIRQGGVLQSPLNYLQ